MRRPLQMILLVLSGTGLLHIALIASGAHLILLGLADAASYGRRRAGGEDRRHGEDGHGHDHSGAPRAAWLLFFPALSPIGRPVTRTAANAAMDMTHTVVNVHDRTRRT